MYLSQVAFGVMDGKRTGRFYSKLLGFRPAGSTRLFRGQLASRIQGIPNVASTCRWFVDGQELFQLEMFEFERPRPRPIPGDWRPCDIGYTRLTLEVEDLEKTLERLKRAGHPSIAGAIEFAGSRGACVYDPEGVLLELVQASDGGLMPDFSVRASAVGLSVPDLARSRRFFGDVLEIPIRERQQPGRDARWGLAEAQCEGFALELGGRSVEIAQYEKPLPVPRPNDYRMSDQGLIHIAIGFRNQRDLRSACKRALSAGYKANFRIFNFGFGSCVYLRDDQGFTVELLCCKPIGERFIGFRGRGKSH